MPSAKFDLSVLVAEDDPLLMMMLEELLDELGCSIAAGIGTVDEGLAFARTGQFDLAILDVNLKGKQVWPLADQLLSEGRRFIIASGDAGRDIQARYPDAIFLSKPYDLDGLHRALSAALAGQGSQSA